MDYADDKSGVHISAKNHRPDSRTVPANYPAARRVRYFADCRSADSRIFADGGAGSFDKLLINFTEKDDFLIFDVRVVPRASKTEIVGEFGGALKVRIASPPIDGAANTELVKLLSKKFGVSKSDIEIVGGETSKNKRIQIYNLKRKDFQNKIENK